MKILLTGAFGNIGLYTLRELLKRNHYVRVFDILNKINKKLANKFKKKVEIFWGDLRNYSDVEKAIENVDFVIHLAAIIPPLADENPELAKEVNVRGTYNIVKAIKAQSIPPKLIFTSSIAVYGDRRKNPLIRVSDPLKPSKGDIYALTKIAAEKIVREAGIDYTIFRLTYITSVEKLDLDPLMFKMPLDTYIEICQAKDVAFALANALESNEVWGKIFNIAGGEKCRTTYKEYLNNMMEIFGLGRNFLPEQAYDNKDFHCGYMDTTESQKILKYQRHTLEDYYNEVREKVGVKRHFMVLIKNLLRTILLKKSEPYQKFRFFKKKYGMFTVSENKLIRKLIASNYYKIEQLEQRILELERLLKKEPESFDESMELSDVI
ncbi:MAG: NAD-dependent epimerase/dehydratase family protein [Promethearchaeota archaeon]